MAHICAFCGQVIHSGVAVVVRDQYDNESRFDFSDEACAVAWHSGLAARMTRLLQGVV